MLRNGIRALRLTVFASAMLLAACGGGGGGGVQGQGPPPGGIHCASLAGGDSQVVASQTCTDCDNSNEPLAKDGSLATHATLHLAVGAAGTTALRAEAASGVVYPAGTPAAVVYGTSYEGSGANLSTTTTLTTYLDGQLQETGNVGPINTAGGPDQEVGRRAIGTSLPFDAIELQYSQSGGTLDVLVDVYEFCTSVN